MDEKRVQLGMRIETRISKNNRNYYVLVLRFDNGYEFETFLNNEQYFCIKGSTVK